MFGGRLRELRKSRQVTLRQLAQRTGMDQVVLNKIELGMRMPPALEQLLALSDALSLTSEEFEGLLDLAAQANGESAARYTVEQVEKLKVSPTAGFFFTRWQKERED
ncbi:MAG TPA: helix-turn-helix transcriptional regulator [Armatimonadota bacterium]